MTIGILLWVLIILWFFFGCARNSGATMFGGYIWIGESFILGIIPLTQVIK
jgi:hypothetical protein